MNDHKFCFIICSNSDLMLEESVHYINHLRIPDGYEMDLLVITDADSITSGYNEAMAASDARYKIYMHHDVFILNRNILSDMLEIFLADPQIGMIGMVGYDTVSSNGIMWQTDHRCGNLYKGFPGPPYPQFSEYQYSLSRDGFSYVAEIDGLFMATSHDLPWNTAQLKDWDFYDAFQSINFLEHGFKLAVPSQSYPWCLHDDGILLNLSNYNQYRHLFMEKHQHYLGKHWSEVLRKPLQQ